MCILTYIYIGNPNDAFVSPRHIAPMNLEISAVPFLSPSAINTSFAAPPSALTAADLKGDLNSDLKGNLNSHIIIPYPSHITTDPNTTEKVSSSSLQQYQPQISDEIISPLHPLDSTTIANTNTNSTRILRELVPDNTTTLPYPTLPYPPQINSPQQDEILLDLTDIGQSAAPRTESVKLGFRAVEDEDLVTRISTAG